MYRILRAVKKHMFTLRGFKRGHEVVTSELGELEREVMMAVWRDNEVSVHAVCRLLGESKAYTTVMTTLDRLYKKGLLKRRKDGRAYLYSPRMTRDEFEQGFASDVLEGLFNRAGRGSAPLLSCIVEAVSERDRELLEELGRLVAQKRRELKGEKPE